MERVSNRGRIYFMDLFWVLVPRRQDTEKREKGQKKEDTPVQLGMGVVKMPFEGVTEISLQQCPEP